MNDINININMKYLLILTFLLSCNSFLTKIKNVRKMPILYGPSKKYNINIEHIYPRSFLNKSNFNEIHNMFGCHAIKNSLRSNYKFGIGDYVIDHKDRIYVPRIEDRGVIARTILFMKFKYNYTINRVITEEKLLYNWNKLYEPSIQEINHNNFGYEIQGYDNPFITHYEELKEDCEID
tara:strand:- start:11652 stop:12188 length:537 start_codon:yes stop_codon:yes gene_type:complete